MVINAKLLKELYISGANNLANNYEIVDSLNVFPIPDGDTGTNMMMTIQSGVKNIADLEVLTIGEIGTSFAKGLLLGARGNSGVILSQIFRGVGEGLKGKETVDLKEFAQAFVSGKTRAYKAVLKPVEGTMLTVIREATDGLVAYVEANPEATLVDALTTMVEASKVSLENTPNLLPVLKEANVVDSGGAGIVKILEGLLAAAKEEPIQLNLAKKEEKVEEVVEEVADTKSKYNYSLNFEFVVNAQAAGKIPFKLAAFNNYLASVADTIDVEKNDNVVTVTCCANKVGDIFNFAQQYGEFNYCSVEPNEAAEEVAEVERKDQAIVTVAVGEGLKDLFTQLRADIVISGGQTMNPSIEDFVNAITKLNPKSVIILPNNSNIIMSAKQAAEVLATKGIKAKIVPTTSIQQGITACMGFNPECDLEENVIEMLAATKRVVCGQVTTAVRDSKLNGVTIKSGDFLGIKEKKIIVSSKDFARVSAALVDSMMTYDAEIVTIIAGADVKKKQVTALEKYISETYKHVEVEVKQGDQPVYYLLLAVE